MGRNNSTTYELNYVTANRFYVEIESNIAASFSECSGLGVTIKKEKYLEGGVNDQQRVILGQAEFSDVTLKRGMTDNISMLVFKHPYCQIIRKEKLTIENFSYFVITIE
ncbi:phage tail protein [Nostoc sp.]|uniref:phage tail protein n=1 Tax=Nostoc sp. TaxID=1180 RepID=UPI002FF864D3